VAAFVGPVGGEKLKDYREVLLGRVCSEVRVADRVIEGQSGGLVEYAWLAVLLD
jgi:hypothetical protein